ncbi:MAG TPA: hypothetical protein VIM71_01270, partial [Lacunisphaera sp.]
MRPPFRALALALFITRCSSLLAGSLQVNLSPAEAVSTGAQWRVDSGAWQASGATVTGLAAGSHTVDYNTVAGYTGPTAETVSLAADEELSLARSYTVTTGLPAQLVITLAPAPTTGKWRIDGGSWRSSGYTVTGLLSGPHSIEYYAVSGWASPPTETATLVAGANALQRSYAQFAALKVTLSPTTAKWRIDGGSWRSSGSTATSLVPGSHTVEYNILGGYTPPPTETVNLAAGTNTI